MVGFFLQVFSANAEKAKGNCTSGEIQRKSCQLNWRGATYKFQVDNVSIFDGTWRKVEAIPKGKELSSWSSLSLSTIGSRLFFELKAWDKPKTEAMIQSLHWLVVEIQQTSIILKLDRVIQKRRRDPNNSKGFLYDPKESHKLSLQSGKVKWTSGANEGEF